MHPESLSLEDGTKMAFGCHKILISFRIIDVDVELRESVVTPLAGPNFLSFTGSDDFTVYIRKPLTSTLGIPIAGKLTENWLLPLPLTMKKPQVPSI